MVEFVVFDMDSGDSSSFYSILELSSTCSASDIRNAYKRLAKRWHPDKCNSGNSAKAEQAKLHFQAIQEAYSVLSDDNKRLLYDAGIYDKSDDDSFQEFMGEMAAMMSTVKNKTDGGENMEELKALFSQIFDPRDIPEQSNLGSENWTKSEYTSFGFEACCDEDTLLRDFFTNNGSATCSSRNNLAQEKDGRKRAADSCISKQEKKSRTRTNRRTQKA